MWFGATALVVLVAMVIEVPLTASYRDAHFTSAGSRVVKDRRLWRRRPSPGTASAAHAATDPDPADPPDPAGDAALTDSAGDAAPADPAGAVLTVTAPPSRHADVHRRS
jgi:hypothetical protein